MINCKWVSVDETDPNTQVGNVDTKKYYLTTGVTDLGGRPGRSFWSSLQSF